MNAREREGRALELQVERGHPRLRLEINGDPRTVLAPWLSSLAKNRNIRAPAPHP